VGQTLSQDQAIDVIDGVGLAAVAGAKISPNVERQVQDACSHYVLLKIRKAPREQSG
jgi:hypothetical protein